ncbi:hypothetical protein P3T76_001345 [Phytophthora citrophthora]|uniref:Uncharacterized protein n=1 Tax=Phytophthora citrophthora TaxID=4793 RepID=A0AAD9GYC9_9STRA|nr:hypothetical protein P3T76_001345 [Phytophthora citrophthora]
MQFSKYFISNNYNGFLAQLDTMYSLPFRLLVVDELDLQDTVRGKQPDWHPPGVVEESDSQPLWKSKANATFPQELGLILLTDQPAAIKSLCVTVVVVGAPTQNWKQCCNPIVWQECPPQEMNTFREMDTRVVQLGVPECSFIKLVIQAPHQGKLSRQILLEDIEILGSTEDQNPSDIKRINGRINHRFPETYRPTLFTLDKDYDELQSVLLDAGVPMDLVVQVSDISDNAVEIPTQTQTPRQTYPELSSQGNPVETSGATLISEESSNQDSEKGSVSPFDRVLRLYVKQTAHERATLQEILATEICFDADDVSSWQSPTVSPTDPANSNEIVLYTFGIFFTQCLLCGGADIQVTCLQMAERTIPLLKKVLGATSAFEGLAAVIVLGIREANTSRVFQSALYLAYTVFQTEVTREKNLEIQIGGRNNDAQLRLIEEVDCANWSYGIRVILEWTLASPICWSTSCTGKTTPPSVNRDFLQFIRLLVNQDETRTNFFNELLDLIPTDNDAGLTTALNRLRLLRLVLRNDLIRCHLTANVKTCIQNLCTQILGLPSDNKALKIDDQGRISRLASECLVELEGLAASGSQNLIRTNELATVHRHLEIASTSRNHHSQRYYHTPFFIHDPLSDAEEAVFIEQLRHYFSLLPRPNALYRHSFVRASQTDRESFQKGNIIFQGQVIERELPKETFHQELERKTAPFVFNISNKKSITELSSAHTENKQNIVSSFAAFKGTIERRSESPRRSNKVSPAQEKQTTPAPKPATAINDQFVASGDNAVNTLPDGNSAKNLSTARVPDISTTSKSPRAPTKQSKISLVSNFPAPIEAAEEKSIQAEIKKKFTANRNDHKTKTKGKEKVKTSSKNSGNDPDNCVLQ